MGWKRQIKVMAEMTFKRVLRERKGIPEASRGSLGTQNPAKEERVS